MSDEQPGFRPYVLGIFTQGHQLALIRKQRPQWQAGLLNGIGGRVERGETPDVAMAREFGEETGYDEPVAWRLFCVVTNPAARYRIYCFHGTGELAKLRTMTDEPVVIQAAIPLPDDIVGKVRWLVPLAMDPGIQGVVQVSHNDQEIGDRIDDDRVHPVTGTRGHTATQESSR